MPFMSPVYPQPQPQPFYLIIPGGFSVQPAGSTTRTAGKVYMHDIVVTTPVVATAASIAHGGVAAGNFDIGIYTEQGNLVVNTGITSAGGLINSTQRVNFPTPTILPIGRYFIAFVPDNATDTYFARQALDPPAAWANVIQSTGTITLPLPATFAAMGGTSNFDVLVPIMINIQGGL